MTNKHDKSAKPAAVELRDDALDQAAGGGGVNVVVTDILPLPTAAPPPKVRPLAGEAR